MPRYRITIRKNECELSYEDENLKTFKDGLPNFIGLVDEFEKPAVKVEATASKRGGGRRPPFIKNAVLEIIEKEPEWFVNKSPDDVADRLRTQYGVPGAKRSSVNVVLCRLFKKRMLTRQDVEGKYSYSVLTVPQ